MLKYFPFLSITTDVQTLRQERPFLFLCVVAVATPSTQVKMVLGKRIKQTLADRIILEPTKTTDIDLLLGLLTFLAWGHDYLINKNPASLSRFMQLAMTLAFELRLNKPPLSAESNLLPVGSQSGECSGALCNSTRSLEEMRALLGCFLMSSIISSYLGHIDPLQWTPYMEECLESLRINSECPGDDSLVCHVQLQLIANESDCAVATKTPPIFYVKALIEKLDRINVPIPPSSQTDRILLASVYYTQIGIFSKALSDLSSPDMKRIEHHGACINTIRMALDNFFDVPISEYSGTSFPFFAHLARSIVVLYKLSTMKNLILDRALVLSSVDILHILDRLIQNIQQARSRDGEESAGGLLDRSMEIFTSVRSWCAMRLAEMKQSESNPSTTELSFTDASLFDFFPFEDSWVRK
ncbi:hypothetical protein VHEMI03314 [[Torrubiella] hemipterigena]|nr:hypothetical protein VHEMI03314 [[Torrubiella] hemipterigena]